MALRTPEAYKASLKDGRAVYHHGRRVDVTTDPYFKIGVENTALDFWIAEQPEYRPLAVVEVPGVGPVNRMLVSPRSREDLLKRRELVELGSRLCHGFPPFAKEVAADILNALAVITPRVDQRYSTRYRERVETYRRHLQETDGAVAGAVTDVKGNRALRPSQQKDPDLYVRIAQRRNDGIVVRGAKVHITSAPVVNELLVCPTRAMSADDADWALSFAVPVDTPGVKLIVREMEPPMHDVPFDRPLMSRHEWYEALIVFDDVFVPWERVFLGGEAEFAGPLANLFATYHRFTAAAYKLASAELFVGAAALIAEANGTEKVAHIRDKLSQLIVYMETIKALNRSAAENCQIDEVSGIAMPNVVITNMAKLYFADNYHTMVKQLHDIAGGLVVTAPSGRDLENPETGPLVRKYLAGAYPGEARLQLMKLIRDLTASELGGTWEVTSVHAEGSLAAQRLAIVAETNLSQYKALAKRACNLE